MNNYFVESKAESCMPLAEAALKLGSAIGEGILKSGVMDTEIRYTGTVLKYLAPKMYGFIKPDDGGADVFYHISKVTDPKLTYPAFGNRVSFGIKEDSQGRIHATQIEKVEGN